MFPEIRNAYYRLRQEGLFPFLEKVSKYALRFLFKSNYPLWILLNEPSERGLKVLKEKVSLFPYQPKFILLAILENPNWLFFEQMIQSVRNQVYQNYQLFILVNSGLKISAEPNWLTEMNNEENSQIRIIKAFGLDKYGKSELIPHLNGDYIGWLGQHQTLAPGALLEIVRCLNEKYQPDLVYSDEDVISADGTKRITPIFKPDWSPDTFLSENYIGRFCLIRNENFIKEFLESPIWKPDQVYPFYLGIISKSENIFHIRKVLYHQRKEEKEQEKENIALENKLAIGKFLKEKGRDADVLDGLLPGTFRVKYRIKPEQFVSIIIPTKDKVDLLETCTKSILLKTSYRKFEIIIINNQSAKPETYDFFKSLKNREEIRIIDYKHDFNFSAINNFASKHSIGNHLLFMNNDTEVISPEWMEAMLEFSQRSEVGAVGAKLYYPNGLIQHAGVIIGIRNGIGHCHRLFPRDSDGYQNRLKIIQNYSAVTGACMMVPRKVFDEVGGFEEDLAITYNDIDLCLKIRQAGYLVVFTPFSELYHYELVTRGTNDTAEKFYKAQHEATYFRKKWQKYFEKGDPYYNPNLSHWEEDFSMELF